MGKFKEGTRIRLINGEVTHGAVNGTWSRKLGEIFIAADDYSLNAMLNVSQPGSSQAYYRKDGVVTHCPASYWELAEPVSEETVVVKKIHTGNYDGLEISNPTSTEVTLEIKDTFDKERLSKLITTLQSIHDALN
jgi:hypothetical protein